MRNNEMKNFRQLAFCRHGLFEFQYRITHERWQATAAEKGMCIKSSWVLLG